MARAKKSLDYSSMLVTDLKDLLRERGLKVGGKKQELIDRLEEDDAPKRKTPAKSAKKSPAKAVKGKKSPAKATKSPVKGKKSPAKAAKKRSPAKKAPKFRPDQISPDNELIRVISLGDLDAIKDMDVTKRQMTKYMNMAAHDLNMIKYLVKEGGDPSMGGTNRPLQDAAFYGKKDVVKFLLKDKRVQKGNKADAIKLAKTIEIKELIE